jgi:N utilization substance protein B
MPARRKSRQKALQILFSLDLRKNSVPEALQDFEQYLLQAEWEEEKGETAEGAPPLDTFTRTLVQGTAAQFEELDTLIRQHAENWRVERMPAVDRNVLRMAIYEMKEEGTPPAVVIDEALELARRYSEEEAIPFINGVLDSVRKSLVLKNS